MITIEPYEVGRMYKVPTVLNISRYGNLSVWPVIGAAHEDAKIIRFPHVHYHYDARFMTDRQLRMIASSRHAPDVAVFSMVMFFEDGDEIPPIVMAWRKCRRAYNAYPDNKVRWIPALEDEYEKSKIDERLICPHRGASLEGLQSVNGCVTCPLHGLRWDCKTGELRKRGRMKISDIKQTGSINSKIFKALREFGYSNLKFEAVEESVKAVIEGTDSNTNVIHVIIRKTLQEVCDIANDPTLKD